MVDKKYAKLLDELIANSSLTLDAISKKTEEMGHKVTSSYLSKLRNGKMPPPSYKMSVILAKVLGVKPEKLIAAGVMDDKESTQEEIIEALRFAEPEADESLLKEKTLHLSIQPDYVYKDTATFSYDFTESQFEKALEKYEGHYDVELVENTNTIKVPVLGYIAAGKPIFADEHIEEEVVIPNLWNLKYKEVFILRVKGDSMVGSRIFEGDKVVVKVQPDVENGEIAVVNVNGYEATLKKVKKLENGQTWLYPSNDKYDPILLDNENARIIGKVVQVMFEPH